MYVYEGEDASGGDRVLNAEGGAFAEPLGEVGVRVSACGDEGFDEGRSEAGLGSGPVSAQGVEDFLVQPVEVLGVVTFCLLSSEASCAWLQEPWAFGDGRGDDGEYRRASGM